MKLTKTEFKLLEHAVDTYINDTEDRMEVMEREEYTSADRRTAKSRAARLFLIMQKLNPDTN